MKLKMPAVSSPIGVITRGSFDSGVMFVGRRVRTADIRSKALGLTLPPIKQMQPAFLVVSGDKPGILVHPVRWDGTDVYQRGQVVGSLKALNSTKHVAFKAEIDTEAGMVKRALSKNQVVSCTCKADGKRYTVALLNANGDLYVAGIYYAKGALRVLNMEPVAHYNAPEVQFVDYKDETVSARAFLKGGK